MTSLARAVLAIAGLAGCSASRETAGGPAAPAPAPASSPSLEQLLQRDLAAHDAIAWSAARRLRRSDFRADPARGSREVARTGYGIYYASKCRGRAFEFRVIAAFHPRESWVKAEVVRDSAESRRTLRHEQTHFNIAEVYARRMRRHFRELVNPCARSDAALEAEAQRLVREERATQRRYDAETEHGLELRRQAQWEGEIGRQVGM
ncbi:MAG: DUF922 domain-containing protein [Gemmatimonadales bacterium]